MGQHNSDLKQIFDDGFFEIDNLRFTLNNDLSFDNRFTCFSIINKFSDGNDITVFNDKICKKIVFDNVTLDGLQISKNKFFDKVENMKYFIEFMCSALGGFAYPFLPKGD